MIAQAAVRYFLGLMKSGQYVILKQQIEQFKAFLICIWNAQSWYFKVTSRWSKQVGSRWCLRVSEVWQALWLQIWIPHSQGGTPMVHSQSNNGQPCNYHSSLAQLHIKQDNIGANMAGTFQEKCLSEPSLPFFAKKPLLINNIFHTVL